MNYWTEALNKFLPNFGNTSLIAQRKAGILVFAHLFFVAATLIVFCTTFFLESKAIWWFLASPFLIFPSLWYFKKYRNTKISGNTLALICCIMLYPAALTSGGLYSVYIPWLFVVPLSTCLVEELKWSAVWLMVTFGMYIGIYIYGLINPSINLKPTNDLYQLISYIFVGSYIFCILIIFEGAQLFAIKILKDKNSELSQQKYTISQQLKDLELIELKLKESNAELQNFAFAASHDLKEPLRMIGMYTQLIQRRLKSLSDDNNITEYMFFVTDGVKRMQSLLDNLLSYSRLGKNTHDTKDVDLNDIFNVVKNNLTVAITESATVLDCQPLPHLKASVTEMTQLFQNLISNSIKFRKPDTAPQININYIDNSNNNEHLFAVIDNGIGIKQEHMAKVFDIFTRLHSQSDYEGTGIGLATCKKIIHNLGGRIWLSSTEGEGTTFYFTIPKTDIIKMDKRVDYRGEIEKAA